MIAYCSFHVVQSGKMHRMDKWLLSTDDAVPLGLHTRLARSQWGVRWSFRKMKSYMHLVMLSHIDTGTAQSRKVKLLIGIFACGGSVLIVWRWSFTLNKEFLSTLLMGSLSYSHEKACMKPSILRILCVCHIVIAVKTICVLICIKRRSCVSVRSSHGEECWTVTQAGELWSLL